MVWGVTGSITMALTESEGKPVSTRVQAASPSPPVSDFQRPPLAEPAQTISGLTGFTARERTRPPMLFGPSELQRRVLSITAGRISCLAFFQAVKYADSGMRSLG